MKTQILEGKNVKLIPLMLPETKKNREKRVHTDVKGWDQTGTSFPRSARDDRKRREARFIMRTIGEDRVIGTIVLEGLDWAARSGWLGIGVGYPDHLKRPYTTEATQLMLDFAFRRLELNRVNLNLLSRDEREIRSYEEMGFRYEGTQREVILSENEHLDIIDLGILRSDWELLNRFPPDETR